MPKLKKYKPSKEVKKEYSNLAKKVLQSSEILLKRQKANNKLFELSQAADRLEELKRQYDFILKSGRVDESIIDEMPIHSLKDSVEYELFGKVSKIQFEDMLRASEIKREGQNLIKDKFTLASESRLAEIELLQATIEEILKITNE